MVNLFCYKVTKNMRIIHIFCNSLRRFSISCVYISMKTTKTIILFFFLSMTLQSQWQETEYGFVSIQPVLGDIRWIPDENSIISSYLGDYNKYDLNSGIIIKSTNIKDQDSVFVHISNDLTKSISIKSQALFKHPKVYLVFDFNSIELGGANDSWKDSILLLDELHYTLSSYEANLVSLNDSLVAININYKYGAGQEYWRDITFFYNLKSKTYKSQRGLVQSFNPLSNYTVLKSVYRIRDYPDIDNTHTLHYSYNINNDIKNNYSNLDHNDDESVVIGNIGAYALFFNKEYQEHFKNGIDKPELVYKDKFEESLYCFSDDESFVIRLNSNSNDSKLTITKFGTAKAVDSISFISNSKLIKYLFSVVDYVYVLDDEKYLHKVLIPYFSFENIKSDLYSEKTQYEINKDVHFTDISAGSPTKWKWNFGDGTTSEEQNPTKVFTQTGEYNVGLIVENKLGLKDTLVKENYIKIIPKLEASFTYEIISNNPLEVRFSNTSKGEPVKYVWNFGDGYLSNEENPQHIYNAGNYDITLTVFDEYGNFDQKILLEEFDNSIKNPPNIPNFDLTAFTQLQLPTTSKLTDVEFFNGSIGIIVSESGEIFNTNDGGMSWEQSEFAKKFKPNRLRFLSNGDAIIVGDSGTYIKSFDFGKNWNENNSIDIKRNIIDFDCISPFDCQLLTDINLVLSTNNKLDVNADHQFKATYSDGAFSSITTNEPLKSILANGKSYLVGTEALFIDKINSYVRYFHTLMITTDFESYKFLIHADLKTDKKGIISELERLDSFNILYSLNNNTLYYFYTNSTSPPYEIITTNAKFDKFYSSLNQIVVPLSDGNLVYIDSMVYNNSGFKSRKTTIKLDDSPLYDYHQINPTKGIVIGESGKYYITDFTTEVKTLDTTPEIDIYPNPITDVVNIQFSNMIQVESLEIYSITGNLIEKVGYNQYTNNIVQKTENLTTGVYIVKIITSSGVFHKKIVKF